MNSADPLCVALHASNNPLSALLVTLAPLRHFDDAATIEMEIGLRASIGRAAWEAVGVSDESFVRYLAAHVHNGALPPITHAADMWLACACSAGAVGAAEVFVRAYRGTIERAAARIERTLADDVTQVVLTSLLVRT